MGGRPWTYTEDQYLKHHAADGVYLIAAALSRTPNAVKCRGSYLHVHFPRTPERKYRCPLCGAFYTSSASSFRFGFCEPCWTRQKTEALYQKARTEEAMREYNAAKNYALRVRKKKGQ